MKLLRVVNWKQYQHYKQRNPPWVKLHRSILQSRSFIMLDDASKLLAFVCILLAGDTDNQIPADLSFIKARANLQKLPNLQPLIDAQFIELVEDSYPASKTLADASNLHQKCLSETETETETETDINPLSKRAHHLPEDWTPKESHYELAKELSVIVDVQFPKFRDYFLGNGGKKVDWDRTFNNWLRRATQFDRRNGSGRQRTNTPANVLRVNAHGMAAAEAAREILAERDSGNSREFQDSTQHNDAERVAGRILELLPGKIV